MEYLKLNELGGGDRDESCRAALVLRESARQELDESFLLPDYLPDAKKILHVTATPLLRGRFLGSGCLEYEGSVICRVLYFSEDKTIREAKTELPFSGKFTGDRLDDGCVDCLRAVAETVNCRMLSPRKFSLRMKAGADCAVFRRVSCLPTLSVADGTEKPADAAGVQTCLRRLPAMNLTATCDEELRESLSIPIPDALPTLVGSKAAIFTEKCQPLPGGVRLTGRIEGECLYALSGEAEGEALRAARASRPFSLTLDGFVPGEGSACLGRCTVTELRPELSEEEGGGSLLTLDIGFRAEMLSAKPHELRAAVDAYPLRPDRECACRTAETEITRCLGVHTGGFTAGTTIEGLPPLPEGEEPVLCTSLRFSPDFSLSRSGKPLLEGVAELTLCGAAADGSPFTVTKELPLRYEADLRVLPGEGAKLRADVTAEVCPGIPPVLRQSREGLSIDFEIFLSAAFFEEASPSLLEEVTLSPGTPGEKTAGELVFFYPTSSETLWDAAKKYRVPPAALAAANGLSEKEDAPLPALLRIPAGQ